MASVKNDADRKTNAYAKEHERTCRVDSGFKVKIPAVDGRIDEEIEDVADSLAEQSAWNDKTPAQGKPNHRDDHE